jgi:hypothetical protein
LLLSSGGLALLTDRIDLNRMSQKVMLELPDRHEDCVE